MKLTAFILLVNISCFSQKESRLDKDIHSASGKVAEQLSIPGEADTLFQRIFEKDCKVLLMVDLTLLPELADPRQYVLILDKDSLAIGSIRYECMAYASKQDLLKGLKAKLLELSSNDTIRQSLLNYKDLRQDELKDIYFQYHDNILYFAMLIIKDPSDQRIQNAYLQKLEQIKTGLYFLDKTAARLYISHKGEIYWDFLGAF